MNSDDSNNPTAEEPLKRNREKMHTDNAVAWVEKECRLRALGKTYSFFSRDNEKYIAKYYKPSPTSSVEEIEFWQACCKSAGKISIVETPDDIN